MNAGVDARRGAIVDGSAAADRARWSRGIPVRSARRGASSTRTS
jgi:hypothetical protein